MTRFWRDGFYRTNIYGTTSWVEGHWVERDDWSRWGGSDASHQHLLDRLRNARALGSESARYLIPNATCPVCGAEVFFFQNEHGSRVFFDELGTPWPKHPCTDVSSAIQISENQASSVCSPDARADDDVSWLGLCMRVIGHDRSKKYRLKFKKAPPRFARILRRLKKPGGILLILQNLDSEATNHRWFAECNGMPRHISDTAVLVVERNRFSFFDTKKMEPMYVEFRRLKSASEFAEKLVSVSTAEK